MDKIDILNREQYVERLLSLMQNISEAKSSTCFAINGTWGCGKSFVLDMLEEKLNIIQSEATNDDRYFVIRYNCWQYDYYEEPLISIVATMISAIEEKTKLFPDGESKTKILETLKASGIVLLSIANAAIKEKTGLDAQTAFDTLRDGSKAGESAYKSNHEYDVYFRFNQVMKKLSKLLAELSENYTLVFIVDELDRCIPEYAIKVLERLHHLIEERSNIITLIAIDKVQLVSSVEKLFGFKEPEKYLEKFINFEIKLDKGDVSEQITEKYSEYISLFDKDIFQFDDSVEECLQYIFKDIDIRAQEQIVQKTMVAHKLLFTEKRDYSFMCMELLTTVMICVYKYQKLFNGGEFLAFDYNRVFSSSSGKIIPPFSNLFKEKFETICFRRDYIYENEKPNYLLPNGASLYGAIIYTWCWMHKDRDVIFQHNQGDAYTPIENNHKDLIKFAEMINLMQ